MLSVINKLNKPYRDVLDLQLALWVALQHDADVLQQGVVKLALEHGNQLVLDLLSWSAIQNINQIKSKIKYRELQNNSFKLKNQ